MTDITADETLSTRVYDALMASGRRALADEYVASITPPAHEMGMSFSEHTGVWTARCSCGYSGSTSVSIGQAENIIEAHMSVVAENDTAAPARTVDPAKHLTLRPADDATARRLERYDDTRMLVEPTLNGLNPQTVLTDRWVTVVDAITGLVVQVRRADCGAGCRCAGEVRLAHTQPKELGR